MSDHEIWQDSTTTEESWSDNGDGEWPVDGIVGEEVSTAGDIKYEVAWRNWTRSDGTNTTWMPNLVDRTDLVNSWKRKQNKIRRDLAEESLDIAVQNGIDVNNINTVRRAQAFSEKMAKRKQYKVGYKQWDLELEKNIERLDREMGAEAESHSRRLRVNSTRPNESARPRAPSVASSVISISSSSSGNKGPSSLRASSALGPSSSRSVTHSASTSGKSSASVGNQQPQSRRVSATELRPSRPLPRRVTPLAPAKVIPSRRLALQAAWNDAIRATGAAAVSIVNDVDEEEIPPLVLNFEYCEDTYIYSRDVPAPNIEYLVACECAECVSITFCDCQLSSDRDDREEEFAYVDGLFTFKLPQGAEVIECNERCSCDATCPNRVAQKPRQFPIEIFKTETTGWGARASVAIERGQVLGIYTGKLIRRAAAEDLPDGHNGYLFDLDSREGDGDDNTQDRYSVDSYECGNWTRFVNHSCDPNTRVYPVLYHTIPQMNQPYLAFVATKDIPVRVEFTISYNPTASTTLVIGDGKGKQKVPEGALSCHCSSKSCLGWRL